jgi:hypothetical protein
MGGQSMAFLWYDHRSIIDPANPETSIPILLKDSQSGDQHP